MTHEPKRLRDLEGRFVRLVQHENGAARYTGILTVPTIAEAGGVCFLCPLCFERNGNTARGTHAIICWSRSRGIPEAIEPRGRWKLDGTSLDDLTLNADPPGTARSILIIGGCAWHGFIDNGVAHE